ncbi:hypothetical protein [Candidatus Ichthyocystis hellenicum]|uniref:hypothetical protein n=1 Tax=Candidatus Ichthyocystis hellenicum TaxID=1561003 RepID=UPI000B81BB50|nr:hypothetical protein [Candidatus Ichthyocystis hellenicum]
MKSIFGVDCKGSVDNLMQLSQSEVFEVAVLVKRNRVSFSRYESISESGSGCEIFPRKWRDFCSKYFYLSSNPEEAGIASYVTYLMEVIFFDISCMFPKKLPSDISNYLWRANPIYQVVNSGDDEDIIKCYYEKRDRILFLREPIDVTENLTLPALISLSDVICYYDPLCFFPVYNPVSGSRCVSLVEIRESMSFMISSVRNAISNLEILRSDIGKLLYHLSMSSLLQLEKTFSDMDGIGKDELAGREKSIIGSLKLISCLRNLKKSAHKIKKVIFPVMQICNFLSLENIIEMFELVNSNLYKNEITILSSLLRRKYPVLIESRRLRIDNMLEKVKKSSEGGSDIVRLSQVSVDVINKSVEKLINEIKEMEMFLVNFSGEKLLGKLYSEDDLIEELSSEEDMLD